MPIERQRDLPFLREYLEKTATEAQPIPFGAYSGVIGVLGMFGLTVLLASLGVPFPYALLVGVLVGGPLMAVVTSAMNKQALKKRTPEMVRRQELRQAAIKLHALKRKQLGKALGVAASELLEAAAKYHNRAHASLNGPFWTNPDLPSHWKVAREQALASADAGMCDLILIAEDLMTPVKPQPEWQEVVGEFVGDIFGVQRASTEYGGLPPEYAPARAIAERLKLLAEEVERATLMVIQDHSNQQQFSSVNSLEAALSEIRGVQIAETEARQDLEQS